MRGLLKLLTTPEVVEPGAGFRQERTLQRDAISGIQINTSFMTTARAICAAQRPSRLVSWSWFDSRGAHRWRIQ
jgi:hypothetical protein